MQWFEPTSQTRLTSTDAVKGCFAAPWRTPDVSDVPRDHRLVGSNGKGAVLAGDRRQLRMLPFAELA